MYFGNNMTTLQEYSGLSHAVALEQLLASYAKLPETVDIDDWFSACVTSGCNDSKITAFCDIITERGFLSNDYMLQVGEEQIQSFYATLLRWYYDIEERLMLDVLAYRANELSSKSPYRFAKAYSEKLAISDFFVHAEPLCDLLMQEDYDEIANRMNADMSKEERLMLTHEPFVSTMLTPNECAQELRYTVLEQLKAQASYNTLAGVKLGYWLDNIE